MTEWITLCVSAFLAGAVNSIAGGGTLLTFPALLWAFGPTHGAAVLANGTSTVSVFPGSVASVWGYRRELKGVRKWIGILTIPSFLGGLIGTLLVVRRDPDEFRVLVPWLILAATLLFLIQPSLSRWLQVNPSDSESTVTRNLVGVFVFQFFVALYGGYFGAGIGILMLSALSFLGIRDIHQINALKAFLASSVNVISVAIFIYFQKVDWQLAVPMIFCSVIGGYLGARAALRLNKQYVRYIVIAIGLSVSTYYMYQTYLA